MGETILAESAAEIPGGKGANQAVAAARAGGDVTMIGRVGDDAFSAQLIESLIQEAIDIRHVHKSVGSASGLAIVAVENSGENSIMVVPGANNLLTSKDVQEVADLIGQSDCLLIQLEIPIATVQAAIQVATAAGVPVILDPAPMPSSFPEALFKVDGCAPTRQRLNGSSAGRSRRHRRRFNRRRRRLRWSIGGSASRGGHDLRSREICIGRRCHRGHTVRSPSRHADAKRNRAVQLVEPLS